MWRGRAWHVGVQHTHAGGFPSSALLLDHPRSFELLASEPDSSTWYLAGLSPRVRNRLPSKSPERRWTFITALRLSSIKQHRRVGVCELIACLALYMSSDHLDFQTTLVFTVSSMTCLITIKHHILQCLILTF